MKRVKHLVLRLVREDVVTVIAALHMYAEYQAGIGITSLGDKARSLAHELNTLLNEAESRRS